MDIDSEMLPTTVSMSHLDEELMGRLRSITTNNREDLIAQFRATTNAMLTDEGCTFFLELSNWLVANERHLRIFVRYRSFRNLNEAILAYYDAEMPTDKIPQMRFVGDVTIGDGEAIPPNTKFVKTWRVENSGTVSSRYFIQNSRFCVLSQVLNGGQVIVHYDSLTVIVFKNATKFTLVL